MSEVVSRQSVGSLAARMPWHREDQVNIFYATSQIQIQTCTR